MSPLPARGNGLGHTRNRPLFYLCVGLVVSALAVAPPLVPAKGRPLSVRDVAELLKGDVPSAEIVRLVRENGINFKMFDELETQFRSQGASEELIDALRKASKSDEPSPPPAPSPSTGMLKVHSQPGEAQVYVNDEPRGATSPAGDLRLSGLAAGSYTLRVSLTGYKTWQNSIAVSAGETVTAFVNLDKQNLEPAVTLEADRTSVQAGQNVYLRWTSTNATNVDIEPGVGKVASSGSTPVSPRESTTYTLTAIGPGGIKTATAFISVTTPAPAPTPPPAPAVGGIPNFPVAGATFQEIKFFESAYNPPALGSRTYATQFDQRTTRYMNWELHINFPNATKRYDFSIIAKFYYPDGSLFGEQTVQSFVNPGWPGLVSNSGRGWEKAGYWRRGTFRVDLFVNGTLVGSNSFTIN